MEDKFHCILSDIEYRYWLTFNCTHCVELTLFNNSWKKPAEDSFMMGTLCKPLPVSKQTYILQLNLYN